MDGWMSSVAAPIKKKNHAFCKSEYSQLLRLDHLLKLLLGPLALAYMVAAFQCV